MFSHILGILLYPNKEWHSIAQQPTFTLIKPFIYTAVLALIPVVAWYYGTTQIGWSVGDNDPVKLDPQSGKVIVSLFYATMICAVLSIGYMIHWMAKTYGAESSWSRGFAVATYTATPLYIAGAVGFLPTIWLAMLIALSALCYTVYLLFLGMPIVMNIPKERGFLFSSAVIGVCMVIFVMIMGGSVILWEFGAEPSFID